MKRNSISIPESGNYPEATNQLKQATGSNSHDSKVQFFLGQLHLLTRDRQSALDQYRNSALVDTELSTQIMRRDLRR